MKIYIVQKNQSIQKVTNPKTIRKWVKWLEMNEIVKAQEVYIPNYEDGTIILQYYQITEPFYLDPNEEPRNRGEK
ncbi:MAG: hypothetical protein IJ867_01635 [Clostridia bacterium]|nr:hypothetical protein [Clostridia bacterium]